MTRILCTLAALLVSSSAFAQETAWAIEDVASKRFPDAEVEGPKVSEGARVTVLVREEERVRVRVGTDYGWIPAASLSDENPAGALPPTAFDPEALQRLLEQAQGGLQVNPGGAVGGPR
ncbi:MAG: hypothetical protein KC912_17375 [Proteobacteria bacterium]|nr:hypothetical protein [Pseudomonadota bacterium]